MNLKISDENENLHIKLEINDRMSTIKEVKN